jgi:hypothetical protein
MDPVMIDALPLEPPWRFAQLGDGFAAEVAGFNAYGIPAILRAEFTETHATAVLRSFCGSQWYAAVIPADSLQDALGLSETLIAGSGLSSRRDPSNPSCAPGQ